MSYTQTMLSERQQHIVVELTIAGRTAKYIADMFNCSISTLQRIRKRYMETSGWRRLALRGCPKKTTAHDEQYLGRIVKRIRFRSLAKVTQEFVTYLGHSVSKRTVHRRLHRQAIYSRIAVQKPDISLENQLRHCRWCTRTLNWTVPHDWSCLLFSDESRFNLTYCVGRLRVWRTGGEDIYTQMSTHGL